jgi:hypothetical protein
MLKKLKILPESKEETSGEWIKKLESAKEREDISFKIRREILLEAIDVIKDEKNGNCLKLKEPIQLAIYGNAEAKSVQDAQAQKIKPLIDTLMQDVQARLGAQALNSLINTKRFPEGRNFYFLITLFESFLVCLVFIYSVVHNSHSQKHIIPRNIPFQENTCMYFFGKYMFLL